MSKHEKGKRPTPFSLRLTFEERAKIEANAGSMPVGAYIKSLLLEEDAPKYRKRRKPPIADQELLAQVLACLGATRLSSNMNQLARATNIGNFYFDHDTKHSIKQACDDIRIMRQLLIKALGLEDSSEPRPKESPSQSFTRVSLPQNQRPRLQP